MTWSNRLRLFGGLIVVLVVVAGATLVLNQRQGQVASASASIQAVSYTVGSDYAGTVIKQDVKEGDAVRKGAPLLSIQSATLLRDLATSVGVPDSKAYNVTKNGVLTLIATESGVVSKLGTAVGGFVSAGQELATIDRSGSLFVLAKFRVDSYDFARISKGAPVDIILPNHDRVAGKVSTIQVETTGGKANVLIEVTSNGLANGAHDGLVVSGSPVTAILHLRGDGMLSGLKDALLSLREQVGL